MEAIMENKQKLYLIGNAHIDPVWLWRWQEGYAEIKATFRSALDRMKEFPEFIFTCACAAYYQWIEENEPNMFEEIKIRVKEGRWVIVGGWWIQPDCNIPSGESFVRQGLYSQRYFIEKFGLMSKVGYNVDSFGHNGMLPQILKKSGMDYYIYMRPGKDEKELTSNLFWWESLDGSRVMTFNIPTSYGQHWGEPDKGPNEQQKIIEALKLSKDQKIDFMEFYGVGNHGGGPTIANLNLIYKLKKELGENTLVFSSPNEYFMHMSESHPNIPAICGDLQHHASGCYSAHSETKANNRRAEHRLISAEKFTLLAHHILGSKYPKASIQKAWENVMFNQFHDIMGGCSIKEAYQDARECYGEALHIGAEILNSAIQKISWSIDTMGYTPQKLTKEKDWILWGDEDKGTPIVIFNSLSWEISTPIEVNKLVNGITNEKGNAVNIQKVRASRTNMEDKWNIIFMAVIPAMGYRVYWIYKDKEFKAASDKAYEAEEYVLENSFIRLEIESETGYISKLYDKKNNVDVFLKEAAVPIAIDISDSDTWAHGIFEFRKEVGKFTNADVRIIEKGSVRTVLRVTSMYNNSILRQDFILYNDRASIEVHAKLDWHEKHKMLKLSFPVNVANPKSTYEIPYGYIEKPANGEEEPGQQWIDVSGNSYQNNNEIYGVSLLNDSKYSFDVKDNDMRMTIANSSIYADHFGHRDEFCEFMDQGVQDFKYVILPHLSDWKDSGVVKKANELNEEPIIIMETFHKGILPQKFEGIKISNENVIVTALKKAEEENGFVLRCYETSGRKSEVTLEIPILQRKWDTVLNKCEIKTFWIPQNTEDKIVEKNLLEM
jgi:alpha-mannosidase